MFFAGQPAYKLNSGHLIPKVGLGVFKVPQDVASSIVYEALIRGYRHFDCAAYYQNESEVAEGIAKWINENPSSNKREDVFYTTKVWETEFGYEKTKAAVKTSLEKAEKIKYIDLILLHSPRTTKEGRHGSWIAFQEAVASGSVKNIGVSNYGIKHLEELLSFPDLTIPPAVNQIEVHPWLLRTELCEYCKTKGIFVEAYSPLAKGRKFDDPDLLAVAQKHGKTPGQILVAWSLQKGYIVLPKTVTVSRLVPNLEVFDIKLGDEDLEQLEKKDSYFITGWDPTLYALDEEN